jgi:hypothetical protein
VFILCSDSDLPSASLHLRGQLRFYVFVYNGGGGGGVGVEVPSVRFYEYRFSGCSSGEAFMRTH